MILGGDDATAIAEPSPVDHALDQLTTSLDHLVKLVEDGSLDGYDNAGLIGFLQSAAHPQHQDSTRSPS